MVTPSAHTASDVPAKKSNTKTLVVLVVLLLLAGLVYFYRGSIHFDWQTFVAQLHSISWLHIGIGCALVYCTFVLRAVRWAILVRPMQKVSVGKLVGPQFIGFTAVSLFGRLADLARPYLVAQRTGLSIASQIAVYTIERMFDLGAAAVLFSVTLAFAPKDMPHHDRFVHAGLVTLAGTAFIAIFALAVRLAGEMVARFARATVGRLSESAGESIATKLLGFRDGLNGIGNLRTLAGSLGVSLVMWWMIALSYQQTARAFVTTPELATLDFTHTMLLMAASMGASLLQLPILGWFTQIAALAASLHEFFDAPLEAATACGALLLFVTMLCIVPLGLIFAKIEGVSLKQVTEQAAETTEAIAADAVTPEHTA